MNQAPHFDTIAKDIARLLAKAKSIEPADRTRVIAAQRLFERLEVEYHGTLEEQEGETP
jgi:hypothetical protein